MKLYRILEIHPLDAYHDLSTQLVGKTLRGELSEARVYPCWYGGSATLQEPCSIAPKCFFFAVRVEEIQE